MLLCKTEIERGEKKPLELMVPGVGIRKGTLICGVHPGKTLVVTAGVHGCEYPGIEAVRELGSELNPAELWGAVILLPLLNESGFSAGSKQTVPEDGVNLNRAFPGDEDGTAAFRIAAAIERQVYPEADFLLDLHSGDCNEMVMPFGFFPAYASESVTSRSRAASDSLSLPYRVASSAKNGLYSWAAQCGIPALLLERGGAGKWTRAEVEAYKANVYELMEHLEMMEKPGESLGEHLGENCETLNTGRNQQIEITNMVYLEAPAAGFWYPAVKEGQQVRKGGLLGELKDMDGRMIEQFHAQFDGIVLYYTFVLGVKAGDPLVAYGETA